MGKASRIPGALDRLRDQQIRSTALFALDRVRIVPKTIQAPSSGAAAVGGGVGGIGNFLPLSGGTMTGNIAFDPKVIDAPNGRVNLDPGGEDPKDSNNILVTGIGSSPFNIRFIDGAQRDGQFLLYQGSNQQLQNLLNAITFTITNIVGDGVTNTITVTMVSTTGLSNGNFVDVSLTTAFNLQDAVVANLTATTFTYDFGETGSATAETAGTVQTGNIYTNDGNTLVLDGTLSLLGIPTVLLVFNSTIFAGGGWIPATLGGGTGSQTPWIQQIEGVGFTLNQAGKIIIKPIQTDGLEAILELERNDTTPTNGDLLGQVLFKGPDSALNSVTWGAIEVESKNVLSTSKQAQLKISAISANSLLPIIDYTGDDATFRFSSGVSIVRPNANGTKELGTASFHWDDIFSETFTLRGIGGNTLGSARTLYADSAGMVFNMPSSAPVFTHSVNNEIFSLLSNGELQVRTSLANGPTLRLRNNDQTPTNNDVVSTILFTGETSTLVEATYGAIEVTMNNVLNTSKQGQLKIKAQKDNALLNIFDYTGADATLRISSAVDVMRPNTNGTKKLGTSSFFWDDIFSETFTLRGSGGNTTGTARTIYADATAMNFNVPSGDRFNWKIDNVDGIQYSSGLFQLPVTTDLGIKTDGVIKGGIAGVEISNTPIGWTFDTPTLGKHVFKINGTDHMSIGANSASGGIELFDGVNIKTGTTTGSQLPDGSTQKLGFWGATPVSQGPAYTVTNLNVDRSYDADATTVAELADVLGTLLADMKTQGLFE